MMIKRCPIIPIKEHVIYYNEFNADMLEGLTDLWFSKYLLDSFMCYTKLKVIVQHTPAETCINDFCKTRNHIPS